MPQDAREQRMAGQQQLTVTVGFGATIAAFPFCNAKQLIQIRPHLPQLDPAALKTDLDAVPGDRRSGR